VRRRRTTRCSRRSWGKPWSFAADLGVLRTIRRSALTSRVLASLIGIVLACLSGYVIARTPLRAHWQSLASIVCGWVLASISLGAAWVFWPPAEIEIRAVSVGLAEAGVGLLLIVAVGLLVHVALSWAARALHPGFTAYRSSLMGFLGALIAILAFDGGFGGVHPAR